MVLAVLPIVELVEVAESVLEPSDHLGTHPEDFLFTETALFDSQLIGGISEYSH